jgi:hypothetical protein
MDYKFPLPSRGVQVQLLEVSRVLSELTPIRGRAAEELKALRAAILDRAFNGEL